MKTSFCGLDPTKYMRELKSKPNIVPWCGIMLILVFLAFGLEPRCWKGSRYGITELPGAVYDDFMDCGSQQINLFRRTGIENVFVPTYYESDYMELVQKYEKEEFYKRILKEKK